MLRPIGIFNYEISCKPVIPLIGKVVSPHAPTSLHHLLIDLIHKRTIVSTQVTISKCACLTV